MKHSNLILHCGARAITREQLNAIEAPEPTASWCPVPYGTLVAEVERALGQSNLHIVNQAYGVTPENARMFGLLQVANGTNPEDYAVVVGVRGSIDKSMAEGIAVGSSVFVCDNLAFSSEIVVKRKNTSQVLVDLPGLIDDAMGRLLTRWNDQTVRLDAYKVKQLQEEEALVMAWRCYKGGVFPWAKGADVLSEFVKPSHPEFLANGHTVWTFFNAVTEALKPREGSKASGLWTMPKRTGVLHKICDDWAGVTLNQPVIEAEATVVA